MRNNLLLYVIITILSACSSNKNELIILLQTQKIDISDTKVIIVIPAEGCTSCLNNSDEFVRNHYFKTEQIQFIFSNVKSEKQLQLNYKDILDARNIHIDSSNSIGKYLNITVYPILIKITDKQNFKIVEIKSNDKETYIKICNKLNIQYGTAPIELSNYDKYYVDSLPDAFYLRSNPLYSKTDSGEYFTISDFTTPNAIYVNKYPEGDLVRRIFPPITKFLHFHYTESGFLYLHAYYKHLIYKLDMHANVLDTFEIMNSSEMNCNTNFRTNRPMMFVNNRLLYFCEYFKPTQEKIAKLVDLETGDYEPIINNPLKIYSKSLHPHYYNCTYTYNESINELVISPFTENNIISYNFNTGIEKTYYAGHPITTINKFISEDESNEELAKHVKNNPYYAALLFDMYKNRYYRLLNCIDCPKSAVIVLNANLEPIGVNWLSGQEFDMHLAFVTPKGLHIYNDKETKAIGKTCFSIFR